MSAASTPSASRSGTPLGTTTRSQSSTSRKATRPSPPPSSTSRSKSDSTDGRPTTANYFSYPVSRVVSGLYRRLTDPSQEGQPQTRNANKNNNNNRNMSSSTHSSSTIYTPKRTASPFQPPPLTPLTLKSLSSATYRHILTRALAEEIRLLVPPRLQLVDTWHLAYSLERDGSSLGTLYDACRQVSERSPRAGYVLVVRDTSDGAVFGAYLTDPPHPSPHFYGTGECFLWRASVLASTPLLLSHGQQQHHQHHQRIGGSGAGEDFDAFQTMTDEELRRAGFPPPPSADTTNAVRSTTLRASTPTPSINEKQSAAVSANLLELPSDGLSANGSRSGTSTPERIRFKAFPYSGVNDYMMFCETGFLSVGGGDGHYGLWIDDSVEKGVSASCPTFGNEHLSDEGMKFDILGVEVWAVGSS
ncbi:hypothetical protein BGW36DRAFT_430001 [Talaromyces proteolyticus]|uniref:Oxidation resistance protein 1 n=1 Tax=Talaromyces proteolyticus TaxID=1131652 RepID=A0AAD4KPU9_9EURO|nr:uncharacterized protein BGW36DRAFT_430001 [Talaromyces proteolyticus]KAH8693978.1 hypothetical protein BGW36DRAFT_430001 [Talaromyces proteolyticus]